MLDSDPAASSGRQRQEQAATRAVSTFRGVRDEARVVHVHLQLAVRGVPVGLGHLHQAAALSPQLLQNSPSLHSGWHNPNKMPCCQLGSFTQLLA